MFGVLHVFLIFLVVDGLLLLLMIALRSLRCIFWNTRLMLVLSFQCFTEWLAVSFKSKRKIFNLTMLNNILSSFLHFYRKKESLSILMYWYPDNKMALLKGNCHFLEVPRALLFHKNVPKSSWGEAILNASNLIKSATFSNSMN